MSWVWVRNHHAISIQGLVLRRTAVKLRRCYLPLAVSSCIGKIRLWSDNGNIFSDSEHAGAQYDIAEVRNHKVDDQFPWPTSFEAATLA